MQGGVPNWESSWRLHPRIALPLAHLSQILLHPHTSQQQQTRFDGLPVLTGFFSFHWQANALFKEGKLELALSELQQALETIQSDSGMEVSAQVLSALYTNKGAILQKLDRLEEADQALEHAIEHSPTSLQLQHNRGVLLRNMSNVKAATVAFQAAVDLDNNFQPSLQVETCLFATCV